MRSKKFDRSIVEGPIGPAVWKLAWPTMLQNVIAGLQGIIDHAMVGHFVGYTANAAIGVSWQIILVVIVFISSLFTGMAVLVARFAGANQPDKVNRVVYQAFLTAFGLSIILAAIGYFAAPRAARAGERRARGAGRGAAVPARDVHGHLRHDDVLHAERRVPRRGRSATPLRLGVIDDGADDRLQRHPDPDVRHARRRVRHDRRAARSVAIYGIWQHHAPDSVIHFERGMDMKPDFTIIRSLFRFGLPTGVQGIAMNIGGVLMLRFIGSLEHSAAAQAAYAVGYTELFSLITWTSVGLMGAAATIAGQNLGAGNPERAVRGRARRVAHRSRRGGGDRR